MRQRLKVYIKNIVFRTVIVSSSSSFFFFGICFSVFTADRTFLLGRLIPLPASVAYLYHTDHLVFSFILIFPTAII